MLKVGSLPSGMMSGSAQQSSFRSPLGSSLSVDGDPGHASHFVTLEFLDKTLEQQYRERMATQFQPACKNMYAFGVFYYFVRGGLWIFAEDTNRAIFNFCMGVFALIVSPLPHFSGFWSRNMQTVNGVVFCVLMNAIHIPTAWYQLDTLVTEFLVLFFASVAPLFGVTFIWFLVGTLASGTAYIITQLVFTSLEFNIIAVGFPMLFIYTTLAYRLELSSRRQFYLLFRLEQENVRVSFEQDHDLAGWFRKKLLAARPKQWDSQGDQVRPTNTESLRDSEVLPVVGPGSQKFGLFRFSRGRKMGSAGSPAGIRGSGEIGSMDLGGSGVGGFGSNSYMWMVDPNELEWNECIGHGAYGVVFSAVWRGTKVAVKKLAAPATAIDQLAEEVALLHHVRHPNVAMLMGVAVVEEARGPMALLVTEYMERGSLADIVHHSEVELPYSVGCNLLAQAAKGMLFLHSSTPPLLHKDLKLSNILVTGSRVKIADFGMATFAKGSTLPDLRKHRRKSQNRIELPGALIEGELEDRKDKETLPTTGRGGDVDSNMGTLIYLAPEVILGKEYLPASDVFSFGICCIELFSRKLPYHKQLDDGINPIALAYRCAVANVRPDMPDDLDSADIDLISFCLHQQPDRRPTFRSVEKEFANRDPEQSTLSYSHTFSAKLQPKVPVGESVIATCSLEFDSVLWMSFPKLMPEVLQQVNNLLRDFSVKNTGYVSSVQAGNFVVIFAYMEDAFRWARELFQVCEEGEYPPELLRHPICRGKLPIRAALNIGKPYWEVDEITLRKQCFGSDVDECKTLLTKATAGNVIMGKQAAKVVHERSLAGNGKIVRLSSATDEMYLTPMLGYSAGGTPGTPQAGESGYHSSADLDVYSDKPMKNGQSPWVIEYGDLEIMEKLGIGTFGVVSKAKLGSRIVAVKSMHGKKVNEAAILQFYQEACLLRALNHPNIVECLGACVVKPRLCLVMEYVPYDLSKYLGVWRNATGPPLTPVLRKHIVQNIGAGMAYLHSKDIIHRDLKPGNVLIDESFNCRIADFGLARFKAEGAATLTQCGSIHWCAPEILQGVKYDAAVDVYSFAILIWQLYTYRKPFEKDKQFSDIARMVVNGYRPPFPSTVPNDTKSLVVDCWDSTPASRPSFHEILDRLKNMDL